jgi:hypothetical protein
LFLISKEIENAHQLDSSINFVDIRLTFAGGRCSTILLPNLQKIKPNNLMKNLSFPFSGVAHTTSELNSTSSSVDVNQVYCFAT